MAEILYQVNSSLSEDEWDEPLYWLGLNNLFNLKEEFKGI